MPRDRDPQAPTIISGPEASGGSSPSAQTGSTLRNLLRRAAGTSPEPEELDELSERYEVGGPLGRGGMGEVRVARDRRLRREVAIKTLRVRDPGDDDVQRFVQEAQITSQLDHPNIPPVHDIGIGPGGTAFFTMKRVSGRTLSQLLKARDTSLVRRLDVFLKTCDAVAFAHAQGVLHRDLKPSNVMVGAFREVYVLDWGLAKLVEPADPLGPRVHSESEDSDSELTVGGTVMGTPAYMSPEQASGDADAVDERSDVYMLGALLYALLVGKAPFKGVPEDVLEDVKRGGFPAPRRVSAAVPWELEAVVLRAMALDPTDRYPTVEALREDVQRWVEGLPVSAARYSAVRRLAKWAGRHRRVVASVALTSAVAGAALLVLGVAYVASVLVARDRALEAERAAGLRLADSEVALAKAEAEMGRLGDATDRLPGAADLYTRHGGQRLKAVAAASALARTHPPPDLQWDVPDPPLLNFALKADGSEAAFTAGADGAIYRFSLPLGERLPTASLPTGPVLAYTGFVGDRLLGTRIHDAHVEVLDLVDGRVLLDLPRPEEEPSVAVLSADGRVLLVSGNRGGAHTYTLPEGTPAGPYLPTAWATDISADGCCVSGIEPAGHPHRRAYERLVWDVATGAVLGSVPFTGSSALTPTGTHLVAEIETGLGLFELATGERLWEIAGLRSARLAVVRGGERLVTIGADDTLQLLDMADGSLLGTRSISGGPTTSQGGAAVSADGARVLTALGDRVRLWSLGARGDRAAIAASDQGLTTVAVSSDGLLALTGGWDGVLRLWEWRSQSLLRSVELTDRGTRDVAFSADGARALTADRDGVARLVDLRTGAIERTWAIEGSGIAMAALPRGRDEVVVGWEGGLVGVFGLEDGAEHQRLQTGITSSWGLELSPDGSRLLITGRGHSDPVAEVWDLDSGVRLLQGPPGAAYRGAFSPSGDRIAAATHDGAPIVWTGGVAERLPRVGEAVQSIGWSSDGALLATGWYDGTLTLRESGTWEEVGSARLHGLSIVDLAWVPDTTTVLTAGGDGALVAFDVTAADTVLGAARVLSIDGGTPEDVAARHLELAGLAAFQQDWSAVRAHQDAAASRGAAVDPLQRARALWATGDRDAARSLLDEVRGPAAGTLALWRAAEEPP